MSKSYFYVGVSNVAKKVDVAYVGVSNVAKRIKKVYVGNSSGTATLLYNGPTVNVAPAYRQVEYLQSTGTQYIKTGVNGTMGIKCEAVVEFTSLTGTASEQLTSGKYSTLIGGRMATTQDGGYQHYRISAWNDTANSRVRWRMTNMKDVDSSLYSTVAPVVNTKYTIVATSVSGQQDLYVNGSKVLGRTLTPSANSYETQLTLFACNDLYAGVVCEYSKVKIYKFKIYKWSNSAWSLVRNFYPCYRKSDNMRGLYDIVNSKFYTNEGTGTFSIGSIYEATL